MDQPTAAVPHAFGYLVVRTLLPLARRFGRLPLVYSHHFSNVLHAVRCPDLINYLGSCGGGWLLTPSAMVRLMNRTVWALQRRLEREAPESLALTMAVPPPGTPTLPRQ